MGVALAATAAAARALLAAACCAPGSAQVRRAVERARARGRVAISMLDNLGIHTWRGSKALRELLEEQGEHLILCSTPPYDPDANRIEWLWRVFRAAVTHNHQRQTLAERLADTATWHEEITMDAVLRHIGSPFATRPQPPRNLAYAA